MKQMDNMNINELMGILEEAAPHWMHDQELICVKFVTSSKTIVLGFEFCRTEKNSNGKERAFCGYFTFKDCSDVKFRYSSFFYQKDKHAYETNGVTVFRVLDDPPGRVSVSGEEGWVIEFFAENFSYWEEDVVEEVNRCPS